MRAGSEYEANNTNKRGVVVDRDPAKMRIRVKFGDEDDMVSAWIDVLAKSAGTTKTFMMPDIGDEVWCALDAKGEDGCLIGSKYNDQNGAPHSNNNDIGLVWPGGSVHVDKGSGDVTVTTTGTLKLVAQDIELESDTLTHNGVDISDEHKHTGVVPGGGITSVPVQ